MKGAQSDDAIMRAILILVGGGCLTVVVVIGAIVGIAATLWRVWHGHP